MLQEQVIPINFGQGLDKKTDPKAVVAGKFLQLQNGLFTSPNQISKRNGYNAISSAISSGGNLVSPQMVHGFNNELLCADSGLLYSYSEQQQTWNSKGGYISTEVSRSNIDQENPCSGFSDSAILGNYALYAWSTPTASGTSYADSQVWASVVDLTTGNILLKQSFTTTLTAGNPVRCVLIGGTKLGFFYLATSSTIQIVTATISGGAVSFSSTATLTGYAGGGFDVQPTSAASVIVYPITNNLHVALVGTSGTVTSSTNISDTSVAGPVSVSVGSNGNIWVYWTNTTATVSCQIFYAVLSSTLTSVLARTSVVSLGSPFVLTNLTALPTSTTQQTLYYGILSVSTDPTTSASITSTDICKLITVQSNGTVGSSSLFGNGIMPFSHPFTIGSKNYAVFMYRGCGLSPTGSVKLQFLPQPTYYIILLSNQFLVPYAVSRFGSGQAGSQAMCQPQMSFTPDVSVSSNAAFFAVSIEVQEYNSDFFEHTSGTPGGFSVPYAYEVNFSSNDAYRSVDSGEVSILNGGVMHLYDGQSISEFGFHQFPEILGYIQSSSGRMSAGTYDYLAIFNWIDGQGNLHSSTPSISIAATVTGVATNYAVTLFISLAYLSQKPGAWVSIYRTIGEGGSTGSIYYLVSDPIFVNQVPGNASTPYLIFTDTLPDADIQENPQAYTYPASSILENTTPPPSMAMVAHNNRLWFRDDENRNTVWYTKSFLPGTGLSPSGLMTEELDPKYGNVVSLSEMDDKLVVLKQKKPLVISGDGVNDAGTGSTLSFPQFVPSDVGCDQMKSVIPFPNGVMFHSPNGIYLLDRSLGVSYIGMPVESFNSQTITSADLIQGKSQIRFLCSSGLTLVYDYIFNQWSTFTNHTGPSATLWQGTYTYINGTSVFEEAPGTYTDNGTGFNLLLQTSWLALSSIQGFQRVRRLIMLGDFANGSSASHNMSIAAAYDFSTTFQPSIAYSFGSANASGVFQYRERLPIQKCDSISLLIQENNTGDSAEYLDLTNMSFEAGVKRGVNKLGGQYSVG